MYIALPRTLVTCFPRLYSSVILYPASKLLLQCFVILLSVACMYPTHVEGESALIFLLFLLCLRQAVMARKPKLAPVQANSR